MGLLVIITRQREQSLIPTVLMCLQNILAHKREPGCQVMTEGIHSPSLPQIFFCDLEQVISSLWFGCHSSKRGVNSRFLKGMLWSEIH